MFEDDEDDFENDFDEEDEDEELPISIEQLRKMTCERAHVHDEDCNVFVLLQSCHPKSGCLVAYDKSDHVLIINCMECGSPLADLTLPDMH